MENTCGPFLAALRHARGWTQADLAAQLQVTDKAVSRWETKRGYPDVESLRRLSELFDVSINELLAGERIAPESRQQKNDEVLLRVIERNQSKMIACAFLVLAVTVILLLISLRLFYNMGIAADVLNTSPAVICGSDFWLLMDWIRLGLIALLGVLALYLIAVGARR